MKSEILKIQDFKKRKLARKPLSMVTCYDYTFAQILNETSIDSLLVGDSAAMTMHGHSTTLPISLDLMAAHTLSVSRGAPNKFIIGDLPFLSYRKDLKTNVEAAEILMKAGAHAVKLEGARGNLELIEHLTESGVPVMGHLGLTPQSVNILGGFRVQARDQSSQKLLLEQARQLEDAGAFALVLECVPEFIAEEVTKSLNIPTIGIGAGASTDGQVLVLQDLLGMNPNFKPKFVRQYWNGFKELGSVLNQFHQDVQLRTFPNQDEVYKE